jgi:cytochrome P450
LHQEYGPVVRIGPGEVSIGDYQLYRRIYSQNSSTKEESFYTATTLLGHENLARYRYESVPRLFLGRTALIIGRLIRNKAMHSARRKMMSQPFSQQAINENEALITEMGERFVERVLTGSLASPTNTVDVLPFCKLFSLEVICKAAFNKDISAPSTDNAFTFLQALEDTPRVMIISSIFPFFRKQKRLGEYLPGAAGHAFRQSRLYEQYMRSLFREFRHESKLDSTERFMGTPLLRSEDAYFGRRLSEDEAVEEAMGLAFAGSGTTSSTLVYLFYILSTTENHHVQLKLREELRGAGPKLADLKDLPYLNAVIKETMRLYPTIISTLPRVLDIPLESDNVHLPAGTIVGMQNYVHHRDPSVYAEPNKFLPERWIEQSPSSEVEKAFTPFSLGTRNCIGQNLAKAELLLAVSIVFRRLDLRLNEVMTESDMEMEDRFAASPRGGKLMLDVSEIS